jgi:Spy/CpxP family protein refolding chaperone
MFNPTGKGTIMKPWIKRSLIGLFGAGIVLGGISACNHRYERHHMGGEHAGKYTQKMIDRVSSELSLDDAQRQRLVVLTERLREQRVALVGTTTDPRASMQALVVGPTFDRAGAQAIIDEKTGAIRAKAPAVVDATADFFDSLNPEQQQKLREHLQKRHRWFSHG